MKLNFTIRIPQRDMQRLVNFALETQTPEFSYEITSEKGQPNLSEIAEIRKILGLEDGTEFPNKLKSMYEDQILKLRDIAATLGNEIDVTKVWFEQIKNSVFLTNQTENQKLKSLYQVLEGELEKLKKADQLALPPTDGTTTTQDPQKLSQRVALLESEVKIKDARIASLITIEEQLRRTELEKQNYQSELVLLKARMGDARAPATPATPTLQLQKTRVVQQTVVTESLTKTLTADPSSFSQASKTQNLLLAQLNDALSESRAYKARCFELEFQLSQLRQNDEFLKIKAEEVQKFKLLLDTQNAEIFTLNKKNDENVKIIERLNKKVADLKDNNAQLSAALDQKSEKNKKLLDHIRELEKLCGEAKLKNEALIKRINDLEDEAANALDSTEERVVMMGQGMGNSGDQGRDVVLSAQLMKKNNEIQDLLKAADDARKEINTLRLELAAGKDAERQKDLKIQELQGEISILNEKIINFTQKNDDLAKRLAKLQNELAERDKVINGLENRILALQAEIDRLKADMLEQVKAAKEAMAERDKVDVQRRSLADQLVIIEKSVSSSKDAYGQFQNQIKDLETEIERLKGVIRQYENNNSPLLAERDALEADKKRLLDANQGLTGDNERLRNEVNILNQKVTTLTTDYDDLLKRFRQLTEKYESLLLENKALKKDNFSLQETVEKLTKEVDNLVKDKNDLTNTVAGLRTENQKIAKENGDLKSALKSTELKLEEIRNKHANLEKKVEQIINENAALTIENQRLKDKLSAELDAHAHTKTDRDSLLNRLNEVEGKYEEAKATIKRLTDELNDRVADLKRQNELLTNKNADLAKRVTDLENELKSSRAQNAENVKSLQANINQLKRDNNSLKTENESLKRQIEVLKADLDTKEKEFLKALNGLREELEKENQDLAERLQKSEMDRLNLKSENAALLQKIDLLENELAARQAELDELRSKAPKGTQVSEQTLEKLKQLSKINEENRALKAQIEAQRRKNELLDKELKDKSEQLAEYLRNPVEVLTQEMKDQLAQINKIKTEMFSLINDNDQLRRKNQLLEFENKEKEKALAAANARVFPANAIEMKDHLDAMAKANNQIALLKTEIEGLKRKMFDMENQIETLKRQNQNDKDLFENERKKLSDAHDHAQKLIAKLKADIESLQKQLRDAHDEIKKLNEEKVKMNQRLNQTEAQRGAEINAAIDELNDKLYEKDVNLEMLETEKRNLKKTIEFLKEQVDQLSKEPPKWDPIPSIELSDKIKQELKDLSNTKVKLAEAQTQIEMLNRRIGLLQAELEAKNNRLKELLGDADSGMLMKVEDHTKAVGALNAENARLQTIIDGLGARLAMVTQEIDDKQGVINELSQKLRNAYEVEMAQLADQLVKARQESEAGRVENESLKRRIDMLQAEIQGYLDKIRYMAEILKDYSQKVDILTRERAERESISGQSTPTPAEPVQELPQAAAPRKLRSERPVESMPSPAIDPETLKAENEMLQRKVAELQATFNNKIPDYENRIKGLQQMNADLENMKNQQIADLKANLLEKTMISEELTAINENLTKENQKMSGLIRRPDTVPKDAYIKLAADLAKVTQERDALKHRIDQVEAEGKMSDLKLKTLDEMNQKLAGSLKEKTDIIINLERALADAKNEIDQLKQTINRYEQQLQEMSGNHGGSDNAPNPLIQELRDNLDRLQKAYDNEKFENERLRRQIQILQNDLEERDKQLKSANDLAEDLRGKFDGQLAQNAELAKRLAATEDDLRKSKDDLAKANDTIAELNQLIAQKDEEIKQKDDTIAALRNENQALQKDIDGAKDQIENLTGQLSKLAKDLDRKDEELRLLEEENARLRQAQAQAEQTIKQLQSELEELRKKQDEDQHALEMLRKDNDKKDKIIADLEKSLKDLENKVAELSENAQKDAQKIANLEKALADAKAEAEEATRRAEEAERQVRTLAREKEDLENQLKDARDQIDKLKQQIEELTTENSSLKTKISKMENRRSVQAQSLPEGGLAVSHVELDALQAENDRLKKELADLAAQLSQKTLDNEKLVQEMTLLKTDLQNKIDEIDRLGKEIETLAEKNRKLRSDNENLTQKLSEISEVNRALELELAELRQAKAALEEELAARGQDLDATREQLAGAQKDLADANSKLSQFLTEISVLKESLANVAAPNPEEYERLTTALSQIRLERDDLASKLQALEAELALKNRLIAENEETFKNALAESKDLVDKLAAQNQENNNLKLEIEQLKAQLVKAKDEIDAEVAKSNLLKDQIQRLEGTVTEKEAEIAKLLDEISRLKAEIDAMKQRQQDELRARASGKSENPINQDLLNQLTAANEEILRLKIQLEKQERDLADTKRQLADALNDSATKNAKIEALEKDLLAKNTIISDLKNEITKLSANLELLESKVKSLEQAAAQVSSSSRSIDRSSFLTMIEKEIGAYESLATELNQQKAENENLKRKIGEIQQKYDDQAKDMEALRAAKENAEKALQDQQNLVNGLQAQIQKLTSDVELRDLKIRSLEGDLELARSRQAEQPTQSNNEVVPDMGPLNVLKSELNQLKIELQNSRNNERNLAQQLENERQANADLLKRIATLEAELQAANEKINNLSAANNQLKNDIDRVTFDNNMLNQELAKMKDENQNLRTSLDQFKAQNAALKSAFDQLKERIAALESALAAKDKELDHLHKELMAKEAELARTQDELKKVSDERLTLKMEFDKLTRRYQILEDEVGRLRAQITALNAELEKIKNELMGKEKELENAEATIHDLNITIDILKAKIADLEDAEKEKNASENVFTQSTTSFRNVPSDTLAAAEQRWRQSENEYKSKIRELEGQVNDLKDQLEVAQDALARAEKRWKDAQASNAQFLKENGELKSKLESLTLTMKSSDADAAQHQKQIAALTAQNKELQAKLRARDQTISHLESELKALQEQLEDMEAQKKRLEIGVDARSATSRTTVTSTSVTNQTLNLDIKDYLANLSTLTNDLNDARAEIENLKKKLRLAAEHDQEYQQQIDALTQQVETLNKNLKEKVAQNNKTLADNTALKSENETLKIKLRSATDGADQNLKLVSNLTAELEALQGQLKERNTSANGLADELNRAKRELEFANQKVSLHIKRSEEISKKYSLFENDEENNGKIQQKNAEIELLNSQVSDLRRELEAAKRKATFSDEEAKAKDRKLKAAEQRIEALSQELKEKSDAEFKLTAEVMQLKSEVDVLKFKVNALQSEIEAKNALIAQASSAQTSTIDFGAKDRQMLSSMQSELNSLKIESESLKRKVKNYEADLAEKDAQISALTEKLKTTNNELVGLRRQRTDPQEIERLQRRISDLEADLEKERLNFANNSRSSASYELEIRSLRAEIENFKANKVNLENELQNKSREIQKLKAELQRVEQQALVSQYSK
jgi:chromosome segregation ATPase